ncbi:hypothetical protein E2C01_052195 [Portunus trituberculatus]|uniref:Uncharacterized protein n=1 Tax=Portunus trituberculatus TaxID=210409 RepID=A0A5B7GKY2_PORTR|nr:hypothetical protein [Portunus trituberculatus]
MPQKLISSINQLDATFQTTIPSSPVTQLSPSSTLNILVVHKWRKMQKNNNKLQYGELGHWQSNM